VNYFPGMQSSLFVNKTILAPLAGISEQVFRSLCRINGADMVVSEMVSAEGVLHNARNTAELLAFLPAERPIGIQIFGCDPERMAEASRIIADRAQPDFIDINAGCPVPKVIRKNGGAALMKDAGLFQKIVERVVAAAGLPVTVKIRAGWDHQHLVDVEFARIAQESGAAAVTLHPRTRSMMFTGHSMWERITLVKQSLSIPVIGNGDILSPQDGARMLRETGCDSIMIGRGAMGNPWLFGQIRDFLGGATPAVVTQRMKYAVAIDHLTQYRTVHGEFKAAAEMKKHLSWYLKSMPAAHGLRARIFASNSTADLEYILHEYFSLGSKPGGDYGKTGPD
jgi:tRNA-dihydrouridine synthase B